MSERADLRAAYVAEYQALRGRVRGIVSAAPAGALDAVAPATPEWRVRDILAHMVGVADDAVNGRVDGIASDAWTAAQVARRHDTAPAAMLDDWDELAPEFESRMMAIPEIITGQALFDAFTHEHDIRHALGARDGAPGGLDLVFGWVVSTRQFSGLPALRFCTERGEVVSGTGDPVATIGASRFEIARGATGRRSPDEIARWDWDPEPDPPLVLIAPFFRLRETPLDE
jgi:uncharacterized protein (TIGR03083 family)